METVTRTGAEWLFHGEAEVSGYVPNIGPPDRRAPLLETAGAGMEVDVEARQGSGRARPLHDPAPGPDGLDLGLAAYDILRDPAGLPAPDARRGRSGVEPDGWLLPGEREDGASTGRVSPRSGPPGGSAAPDLSEAARSYLAFRAVEVGGRPAPIESWAGPARSPATSETVAVFMDLHRSDPDGASKLAEGMVRMPSPGETFQGFRLLQELGRGAFGRVYLASQGDLADRPVALKVSAGVMTESRTLAQLQHTNIVPIFSAHRVEPLHAVCMPYFGSATLKDIFEQLEDQPSMPTSGRGLVDTLASHRGLEPSAASSRGPAPSAAPVAAEAAPLPVAEAAARGLAELSSDPLTKLGRMSYVGAILWIGARLADGLAHAHGRGILHRDLKPANILLTDSGQPMLLDFNLSEDTKAPASVASFGGTLPYMAPEHLAAFRGHACVVDARSDLYALGIILYELLTGRHPFEVYPGCSPNILDRMIVERSAPPAGLRERNPQISPAVESIVRHCLEPDPDRRYRSASDLLEDLERHLADLPLKHAPEPSARERAAKWSRRHPRMTSSTAVALLLGMAALGVFAGLVARADRLARLEAADSLVRFREEASTARYLLNTRVFDRDRRAGAVALGSEALARYGLPGDPAWRERPLVSALEPQDRRGLLEEVGALLLFLARAGRLDAEDRKPDDPGRALRLEAADRLCVLAGGCFDDGRAPRALAEQRAELLGLMGRADEAARLLAGVAGRPPETALDLEIAASSLSLQGHYRKALPLALEATRLDPRDFWAWFTLGLCHERLGRDMEAAACFGTCIALKPDSPFGWFNRGVVQARRADYDAARADLSRASALDPKWPDALVERAIAENLAGSPAAAVTHYTRAIELGATESRIYCLRADARARAGDAEGARLDRLEGLGREPRDDLGWVVRALSRPADDTPAALADLDRALALNPRSLDALQDKAYLIAERTGRIGEAETLLDRAVSLYPDYVPTRSSRGVMRAILGRREAAHEDARESLWRDTSPRILYQVAGIYAVTSKQVPEDRVEAYRLLSTALRGGFGFEELAEDRELDAIRDQPEFRKLLEAAKALQAAPPGPVVAPR